MKTEEADSVLMTQIKDTLAVNSEGVVVVAATGVVVDHDLAWWVEADQTFKIDV